MTNEVTRASAELAELIREHRANLVSYAGRWTRNRADAEDAVQEACAAAVVQLAAVAPTNPVAWLYGVTRRRAVETMRQHVRLVAVGNGTDWEAAADADAEPTNDGRCMAEDDTARYVLSVLDQLPKRQREVLRLWAVEGLSWPEIAERMGIAARSAQHNKDNAFRSLEARR